MPDFTGEIAVVTGGASGIGEGCARRLAADGATVVILDLAGDRAAAVAGEIGGRAFRLDVADAEAIERTAARVEAEVGPATVLVTSAGVIQRPLPPEQLPLADWDRVLDVDYRGTYLTCVAFGSRMARRGAGSIVTIASVTGSFSVPLHSYAPAKAAILSMTQCLAAEWGRSGVRINAVSPGATWTPALEEAVARGQRSVDGLVAVSCLGRLVGVEEVARAVAFLASADASAITGINLPVDAGWIASGSWHAYGGLRPPRPPA
jgi:NAD(P)-dependent dehydrogenase (short-subunit alcohol dehydrogenase family)